MHSKIFIDELQISSIDVLKINKQTKFIEIVVNKLDLKRVK
jgi:hypothetical protein